MLNSACPYDLSSDTTRPCNQILSLSHWKLDVSSSKFDSCFLFPCFAIKNNLSWDAHFLKPLMRSIECFQKIINSALLYFGLLRGFYLWRYRVFIKQMKEERDILKTYCILRWLHLPKFLFYGKKKQRAYICIQFSRMRYMILFKNKSIFNQANIHSVSQVQLNKIISILSIVFYGKQCILNIIISQINLQFMRSFHLRFHQFFTSVITKITFSTINCQNSFRCKNPWWFMFVHDFRSRWYRDGEG